MRASIVPILLALGLTPVGADPYAETPDDLSPGRALALAEQEDALKPKVGVTDAGERERLSLVEEALRSRPDDPGLRLELAKLLTREAVDGDRSAAERSLALLEDLSAESPDDPVVLVYLGSARMLEAKRLRAFWRKGSVAKEGLRLVDRAAALAPDAIEVRFVRGRSTYALPFFFRRKEAAAADLAWVAERAPGAVARGELAPDVAAAALFYHGVCRHDRGDAIGARAAWREAVRIAPGSNHADAATERLAGYGPES